MERSLARRLPSLYALRAFEAAARHLSFTIAAEELCVTQGAISRQIKLLEDTMGLPLFKRLTRKLELTESGQILFPTVRHALDDMERAVLRVGSRGASGILTVSALPTFAMNWLMPRLPDFSEKHPSIEVQLITTIRAVDFVRDNIDVAIRVGRPRGKDTLQSAPRIDLMMADDWAGIRSDRLLPDQMVPVAAPEFVTRHGLSTISLVSKVPLIHVGTRANAWPDWFKNADLTVPDQPGLVFGHFFQALTAARAGQGVALIPKVLVDNDLEAGLLVIPFEPPIATSGYYYLLYRAHHWNLPKVKAFRDWLSSTCGLAEAEDELQDGDQ
ncbi:LysR family transcriptional regulator [Mesorhizobium atlanticum]|uniref:LysR family transcriptional regulator n=1 Tax=Mesorhizobium atlanticum TaxID=2233532 RepID=A0A330GVR8_9HYPH|nr:LysR family transcriptional regulator [Mesorhizobium atlanticum]